MFVQLLKEVMSRTHIFAEVAPALRTKFFEDQFENALVSSVVSYYYRYKKTPSTQELNLVVSKQFPAFTDRFKEWAGLPPLLDFKDKFLKESFVREIRDHGIEKILVDTAKSLDSIKDIDYDRLWRDVKELVVLTQDNSLGLAAHQDISMILNSIKSSAIYNRLAVKNWDLFNSTLGGGLGKEEIFMYVAPSGRGKTTFLVNLATLMVSSMEKNVLCITTELLDHVFTARIYRRLLKMTRDDFFNTDSAVIEKRLKKMFHIYKSKLLVRYVPPNKLTTNEILGMVEQFENLHGEPVDMVILDYIDKLKIDRGNMYRLSLQDTTEELRAIALEKHLAMITATQSNRESMKKGDTTGIHISEGIGKHQSSDVVVTLQQSEEERTAGLFTLRFDKVRELNVPQSKALFMKINPDTFVIEEDTDRTVKLWREMGFSVPLL